MDFEVEMRALDFAPGGQIRQMLRQKGDVQAQRRFQIRLPCFGGGIVRFGRAAVIVVQADGMAADPLGFQRCADAQGGCGFAGA